MTENESVDILDFEAEALVAAEAGDVWALKAMHLVSALKHFEELYHDAFYEAEAYQGWVSALIALNGGELHIPAEELEAPHCFTSAHLTDGTVILFLNPDCEGHE